MYERTNRQVVEFEAAPTRDYRPLTDRSSHWTGQAGRTDARPGIDQTGLLGSV